MVEIDFSLVNEFLANALSGVMRPLSAFKCDIVPQSKTTDKRGHTAASPGVERNLEPIPCTVRDTTGAEMWVGGRRIFYSGTIIVIPAINDGQPLAVAQSDRVRVHRSGVVPERMYEIEHVGDVTGVEIALAVKRVGG